MSDIEKSQEICLAWHCNDIVRKFAASGGVTRGVIRGALSSKLCDAVYSLTYRKDGFANAEYLTEYPADENAIPCSLYHPVMWGANLSTADPTWKRVLLIGLPCQIRSAKVLLARKFPALEVWAITIFCKKQKEFGYSRYIARELNLPSSDWNRVIFRGQGWPGAMRIRGQEDRQIFYRYPALCWNLSGCRGCFDSLNASNSDLTVTDPWGIIPAGSDEIGKNLVFAWSKNGMLLLHSLPQIVVGKSVTPEEAAQSLPMSSINQKYMDQQPVGLLCLDRFLRLKQWIKRYLGEFYLLHLRRGLLLLKPFGLKYFFKEKK